MSLALFSKWIHKPAQKIRIKIMRWFYIICGGAVVLAKLSKIQVKFAIYCVFFFNFFRESTTVTTVPTTSSSSRKTRRFANWRSAAVTSHDYVRCPISQSTSVEERWRIGAHFFQSSIDIIEISSQNGNPCCLQKFSYSIKVSRCDKFLFDPLITLHLSKL